MGDWKVQVKAVKYKPRGFRQILDAAAPHIEPRVEAVAARAGDGFKAYVYKGRWGGGRPVGVARTADKAGREAEATRKALSQAIDAAR